MTNHETIPSTQTVISISQFKKVQISLMKQLIPGMEQWKYKRRLKHQRGNELKCVETQNTAKKTDPKMGRNDG